MSSFAPGYMSIYEWDTDDSFLAHLTLSAYSFPASAVAGTVIGAINGTSVGSALSLRNDGGRLAISGTNLVVGAAGPVGPGQIYFDIVETLAGKINTPKVTPLVIVALNTRGSY